MWLSICHLQLISCKRQLPRPPLEAVVCVVWPVPSKQGRLSRGFVCPSGGTQLGGSPGPQERLKLWWGGVSGASWALCLPWWGVDPPPTSWGRGLSLQVDYGGTAEELESHFNSCGHINRVTILCDKFSGHPKGSVLWAGRGWGSPGCPWALLTPFHHSYAYIEFEEQSSVKAAVELDESVFRGRVIKVRAGGGPGGLPPPHSQPWVPVAVLNPSSSSPSPPSRCCPRGPTCLASAAPTAGATGATSTPGQGWAAGEATTGGSSPGCEGGPTGESLGMGFFRCGAGCSWDGVPCSPLPPWHGWEDGEGLWQEGTSGILQEFGEWWVGICLSSPRAVPGFGAPLVLGVQPGVAVQEGGALGRVKEQGAMPPCFRMLVLFCLGVGHGWCLGIFHTRKGWTAW